MKIFPYVVLSILFLPVFCTKEKRGIAEDILINTSMQFGLPENSKSINACLYSCYKTTYSTGSVSWRLISHAAFTDPEKGLMQGFDRFNDLGFSIGGNVDVGNVSFNSKTLLKNTLTSSLFYKTNIAAATQSNAVWVAEGNRGFSGIHVKIERGFPLALPKTENIDSLNRTSGFTFSADEYFSNYDSVIVYLTDGFSNTKPIKKHLAKGQSFIATAADFSTFYPLVTQGSLCLYAYNYSHQVINSKTYVFELSTKVVRTVYLFP